LARGDLGLDIIGYKDYVHNLKMFANVNDDITILARDNMFSDLPSDGKSLAEMQAGNEFNDGKVGL